MSGRRDKRNRAARARTEAEVRNVLRQMDAEAAALDERIRQRDWFASLTFGLDPGHEDTWPRLAAESDTTVADLRAVRDLYPHLAAIVEARPVSQDLAAVAARRDLYAYGVWLPGGLLDAFGFHLLDALSDEGLEEAASRAAASYQEAQQHLVDAFIDAAAVADVSAADAESAVGLMLLTNWVYDVTTVRGLDLAVPEPLLPTPVLTSVALDGGGAAHLVAEAAVAFRLLAHWDLHARVGPDSTAREGHTDPNRGRLFRSPGQPGGAATAPPRTRVDGVYGPGAPQPWGRFGPATLPDPERGLDAYLWDGLRERLAARERASDLWWPVATHSGEAYADYLHRTGLGDGRLVGRMVALRPHIETIFHGRGASADVAAVAASGDLPVRRATERPVWLGGAVLDTCGASAVGVLTDEGQRVLWEHILEAKKGPYDPAVHLLACWLQDAAFLWRNGSIEMTVQYLAVAPPLIEEDTATSGGDRPALAEIAAQAFRLLTTWDLHLPVTADGQPRDEESFAQDPRCRALFRAADEMLEFDGATEGNPLPAHRPRPFTGRFGTGQKR